MICKVCNQEIGNAKFCPNCGTENVVHAPVMQQVPVTPPPVSNPVNVEQNNFVSQYDNQNYFQAGQNTNMQQNPANDQFVAPVVIPQQENSFAPQNNFATSVDGSANNISQNNFMPQGNVTVNQSNDFNLNLGYATPQEQYVSPVQQEQQVYTQPQQQAQPQFQPQQPQQPQFNVGHMNEPPQAPTINYDKINDPGKGSATASLVLGIIALFTGWIAGIFALVFASKYNKIGNGANKGNAKAGKIMGIIGIIGGVIATIIVLAFIFIIGAGFASLFSM